MATVEERLSNKLANVPSVTVDDVAGWVSEALDEINDDTNDNAILYLALSLAYESIATDAAKFFSYNDNGSTVDKTMIFDKYIKLSDRARHRYNRYLRGGYGASQTHLKRADDGFGQAIDGFEDGNELLQDYPPGD